MPQFQYALESCAGYKQVGARQVAEHDKGRGKHKRAQQNYCCPLCDIFFVHNEFYEQAAT